MALSCGTEIDSEVKKNELVAARAAFQFSNLRSLHNG